MDLKNIDPKVVVLAKESHDVFTQRLDEAGWTKEEKTTAESYFAILLTLCAAVGLPIRNFRFPTFLRATADSIEKMIVDSAKNAPVMAKPAQE